MVFSALLDTCVLVPHRLRDLLLETASRGAYRPVWTNTIEDELKEVLFKINVKSGRMSLEEFSFYIKRLLNKMNTLPDARIAIQNRDYYSTRNRLKDPLDEHILEGALMGQAAVIVTENLKDFPNETLSEYKILAQSPDDFLLDLIDLHPKLTFDSIEIIAKRSGRHGKLLAPEDVLIAIGNSGYSDFASYALAMIKNPNRST